MVTPPVSEFREQEVPLDRGKAGQEGLQVGSDFRYVEGVELAAESFLSSISFYSEIGVACPVSFSTMV